MNNRQMAMDRLHQTPPRAQAKDVFQPESGAVKQIDPINESLG